MKSCCYYQFATSLLLLHFSLKTSRVVFVQALSSPNNNDHGITTTLSDRFRCSCPAPLSSIRLFDPSLVVSSDEEKNGNNAADAASVIWAAVYRSNQNQPSVFIRDEFLNAMKAAIEPVSSSSQDLNDNNKKASWSSLLETPESKQVPVAVACLRPSTDFGNGCYVLDTLRCVLKKETMDPSCDGGSEHCEAISVAIDSLLLHHLSSSSSSSSKRDGKNVRFEQAIRAKATLISGKLLEMRGFEPISELQKDMATHISSLDACMEKYAERSVNAQNAVAKSPGAQQRALSIVSSLARLDREADLKAAAAARATQNQENSGGKDDFDPFSSITRFI